MKILFSPPDPNLASWWHEQRKDAEMIRYNPLSESSVEVLRERLAKAGSDFAQFETIDTFFWFLKQGEEVLGQILLSNINRVMQIADIGYGVSKHARGLGIASDAVQKLIHKTFSETPLRKLIAYVHEENLASRKVLERTGFTEEGMLREHYIVNGKPANEVIYGLLKREVKIK